MQPQPLTARCLCGAVVCELTPPSLGAAHCHCEYCRRAHGAAFVTWLMVAADRFRIVAGADSLRWYASSQQSRRGFCSLCGTTLLFESEMNPGEMHVAYALIEGSADLEPMLHTFADRKVGWVTLGDGLPELASDSPLLEMYAKIPPPR